VTCVHNLCTRRAQSVHLGRRVNVWADAGFVQNGDGERTDLGEAIVA